MRLRFLLISYFMFFEKIQFVRFIKIFKMIDEKEFIRLKEKNRKLKAKVWNDYRNYSDELRMLKHQNRSLQNSIKLEQNKNRELFQHFSNKISQLQEQIRQVSFDTPKFTSNYSTPKNKQKKDNFQWRFQELEEEGKVLRLETEKTFQKCRESSTFNFWLRDIPPPVTNYAFNYAPIVVSPPQPIINRQNNFLMKDEDDLSSSSSGHYELQDPIVTSSKDHNKKNKNIKKDENYSSNSSTVSVKHNSNKYKNDSDGIKDDSDSNDDYDIPTFTPFVSHNDNNFNANNKKDNIDFKQSQAINMQKNNQEQANLYNSTHNQNDFTQSNQCNRYPPPNVQINQTQQNEAKNNTKLPSPIHIKTHIDDDDSDTDRTEPFNQQSSQMSTPNQQPKQQPEVQITNTKASNQNLPLNGFMSQSNWDDDVDDDEIIIELDDVNENDKKEKSNDDKTKSNIMSNGIQSDTCPILDTTDQHQPASVQQHPTNSTSITKNLSNKNSIIGSPSSKNDFDFQIEINDDDNYW